VSDFSRTVVGLIGVFIWVSVGITQACAVEIPKPVINIPRPTINVPRPAINVPRPSVSVNVPKPNVTKPSVNVTRPTISTSKLTAKVEIPKPALSVTAPKGEISRRITELPKGSTGKASPNESVQANSNSNHQVEKGAKLELNKSPNGLIEGKTVQTGLQDPKSNKAVTEPLIDNDKAQANSAPTLATDKKVALDAKSSAVHVLPEPAGGCSGGNLANECKGGQTYSLSPGNSICPSGCLMVWNSTSGSFDPPPTGTAQAVQAPNVLSTGMSTAGSGGGTPNPNPDYSSGGRYSTPDYSTGGRYSNATPSPSVPAPPPAPPSSPPEAQLPPTVNPPPAAPLPSTEGPPPVAQLPAPIQGTTQAPPASGDIPNFDSISEYRDYALKLPDQERKDFYSDTMQLQADLLKKSRKDFAPATTTPSQTAPPPTGSGSGFEGIVQPTANGTQSK
jgi:hypothetical protein